MSIKQLSIFVENKSGRLAEISKYVAVSGIDIRALSLADTTNFGLLRMIVDKPAKAAAFLKEEGLTVRVTEVVAAEIPDRPGGFSETMRVLSENGIDVEYLYAFVARFEDKARIILRVNDNEKATAVLENNGIRCLKESDVYEV